ncbi:MAG TPA: hypothetical protein VMB03_32050 [Bryobacteraceae bacterium]|nr:hypothetical protein [Bryobacteraceae bacterium]
MIRISFHSAALLLAASGMIFAQQPPVDQQNAPTTNSGWRRATDSTSQDPAQDQSAQQYPPPAPRDAYGQAQPSANRPPAAQRPAYGIPAELTLKAGTFFTMRINQKLADNKNSVGDTFSGTLTQPVVVNGILLAPRGAMVYGRVAEADKIKGMHRLGIEVTGIVLSDGSQAAVHTELMSRQSPPMPYWEHERGAITTATADGSAPAAGATIGVLATKGHNSEIFPATLLTFQTENAVTIHTGDAAGAFRYVSPSDYTRGEMTTRVASRPAYGYAGYPYPYYPYYGWGYPYPYWGPFVGFGIGFGGGYWGGFHGGFRR